MRFLVADCSSVRWCRQRRCVRHFLVLSIILLFIWGASVLFDVGIASGRLSLTAEQGCVTLAISRRANQFASMGWARSADAIHVKFIPFASYDFDISSWPTKSTRRYWCPLWIPVALSVCLTIGRIVWKCSVKASLVCERCGYPRAGLGKNCNCPECGLAFYDATLRDF